MSKELRRIILVFLSIFIVFSAAVIISEIINYNHIIDTYPENGQIAVPDVVQVTMPSRAAFDFQKSKVATWLIRLFFSFAVPAFFLFSKLSCKIRNWAARRAHRWALIIILYFAVYSLIEMLIYLPLDIYTGFFRMHHYGLSNQTFNQWLIETIKSFIVNTAITAIVVCGAFYIIKKSPKRWWFYLAIFSIPYLFIISYVQPVVIDPIFNQYKPVEDSQLSSKIEDLLSRTPIENCRVYQVDKSKETNQMNAYMTGVFNTKRIVLWDTTINYLDSDEVLGVTAHEMGHYLMGHVWKTIVVGGFSSILLLYLIYRIMGFILRKTKGRLGFNKISDIAAFPLLMLLINLMMFITAPATNAYSRSMEQEADRFELELTQNNFATATATVKLHQQSLTMPEPGFIFMLWTYDHPTFKSRVDFANEYRPWEEGRPLKYQKFIKEGK